MTVLAGVLLILAPAPGADVPLRPEFAPPAQADQEDADAESGDGTPPQDEAAERRARIERMIELAATGRAVVRPQAARRLVSYGEEAAAVLVDRAGETGEGLAAFGPELVEVLADFEDPALRALLWTRLGHRAFPWRPQAARALGKAPRADELARFHELLGDHLARVREAAVLALTELGRSSAPDGGPGPSERLLRERLADPDDRVRRAAAATLHDWGHTDAVFWLLEDLRRDDRFFELRTGERARFAAAKLLGERFEDLAGVEPARDPIEPASLRAWRDLEARFIEANGGERPELPPIARAGAPEIDARFGLELRSCRHGDIFLRWESGDVLWVGTGRPARISLPPGTVRRLQDTIATQLGELGETRYFGESGCDTEQLHWRPKGAERTNVWLVSKGAEPVPGLRPEPLTEIARALLSSLPEGPHEDPRAANLRTQVAETLASIGGPCGGR